MKATVKGGEKMTTSTATQKTKIIECENPKTEAEESAPSVSIQLGGTVNVYEIPDVGFAISTHNKADILAIFVKN